MGNVSVQKKKENLLCQNQSHRAYHNFFDETNPFEIGKCKSKSRVSVSEALAVIQVDKYDPPCFQSRDLSIFKDRLDI